MKKKLLTAAMIISLLLVACDQQDNLTPADSETPQETLQNSASNPEGDKASGSMDAQTDNGTNGVGSESQEDCLSIAYSKEIVYTYVKNGHLYQTIRHDYNDQGWVVRRTTYDHLGNFKSSQMYAYDQNGNMTERTSLDEAYKPTGTKNLYYFSEEGKQLKEEYYKNGSLSSTIEYIYDENGLLTKENRANAGKEPFDHALYTYDANGSLVKEERYMLASSKTPNTIEYVCDEQGRVQMRRNDYGGDTSFVPTRTEYAYNDDGSCQTSVIQDDGTEKLLSTSVLDAKGFLISEEDETFTTTISDTK